MTKFWVVACLERGQPTVKHETHQSAIDEAKRLAAKDPLHIFFVLEAMEAFYTAKPPICCTILSCDDSSVPCNCAAPPTPQS